MPDDITSCRTYGKCYEGRHTSAYVQHKLEYGPLRLCHKKCVCGRTTVTRGCDVCCNIEGAETPRHAYEYAYLKSVNGYYSW